MGTVHSWLACLTICGMLGLGGCGGSPHIRGEGGIDEAEGLNFFEAWAAVRRDQANSAYDSNGSTNWANEGEQADYWYDDTSSDSSGGDDSGDWYGDGENTDALTPREDAQEQSDDDEETAEEWEDDGGDDTDWEDEWDDDSGWDDDWGDDSGWEEDWDDDWD